MKMSALFAGLFGVTLSLTGCAPTAQASCDSYMETVGNHLANTINGQVDLSEFMGQLNTIRDGAPEEMKALLNQDLQSLVDNPTELPSNTMGFCKQFLGE